MTRVRARLAGRGPEAGLTLVELLIAAAMSVVIVGAAVSMLIGAVRTQPQVSEKAQAISTARYVLERMTREIRNGISVYVPEGSESTAYAPTGYRVSFVAKVRRTACGAGGTLAGNQPARECQITYDCSSGNTCTRAEAEKGEVGVGTRQPLITGLDGGEVFNYTPSPSLEESPTFVGITLRVPNPSGDGDLTVSDGASMRTPTLLTSG